MLSRRIPRLPEPNEDAIQDVVVDSLVRHLLPKLTTRPFARKQTFRPGTLECSLRNVP
jgi:hypothetical protein